MVHCNLKGYLNAVLTESSLVKGVTYVEVHNNFHENSEDIPTSDRKLVIYTLTASTFASFRNNTEFFLQKLWRSRTGSFQHKTDSLRKLNKTSRFATMTSFFVTTAQNTLTNTYFGYWNLHQAMKNLISWSLELLSLERLRERRLLILLVLVGVGVARVCGLINGIALVCRLEWNFCDARLVAQIREVSAPGPREDRQEREENRTVHVATADAVQRLRWLWPLCADVEESNEVYESPESGEPEIGCKDKKVRHLAFMRSY